MGDWKKHLDVHLRDILDQVPAFDGTPDRKKLFVKKLKEVVQAVKLRRSLRHGYYDEYEMDEMRRCLELCEALDEWRFGEFAGECVDAGTLVRLPLKFHDLELLFIAMDKYLENELIDWARKLMLKEQKKRRR